MYTFDTLSVEEKAARLKWFNNKPNGAKLKRQSPKKDLWCPNAPYSPQNLSEPFNTSAQNSLIKINGQIYEIASGKNAHVGRGSHAQVKFAQNVHTGQEYVLKIQKFTLEERQKKQILQENQINRDVNLNITNVIRSYHGDKYKNYALMHYKGGSLLKRLNELLSDEQRLDIAIDVCFEVFKLHNGILSNDSKPYTHQDIKPANISLDQYLKPTLVDYGLAQNDPQKTHTSIVASPIYMPSINMIAFGHLTQEQVDIWALKRTLYMPIVVRYFMGIKNGNAGEEHGCPYILPKDIAENTPLFEYIDTGGEEENKSHLSISALQIGALCVLGKFQLPSHFYELIYNNQNLAYLTLALHYQQQKEPQPCFAEQLTNYLSPYYKSNIVFPPTSSEPPMNNSEKKALVLSFGINQDIEQACAHKRLINILRSTEPFAIKKAAIILFKLSILDDAPYIGNERLIDLDFIPILKTYPELCPKINQLYQHQQHNKIIMGLHVPVSLTLALQKLKEADSVLSIFEISRNRHALQYLVHSTSVNQTRALLTLFKKNPHITKETLEKLNRFQIEATTFLLDNHLESLLTFVMTGNNALFIYNIQQFIKSDLLRNAKDILTAMLPNISQTPCYVELIKNNPKPTAQFIIYHLITSNIQPGLHVTHLFLNEDTTEYLFKSCQQQSLPLSLIKKIMSYPKAMYAFINLVEKEVPLKVLIRELQSDIRIAQINEQINLQPLPVSHALQELKKPPLVPRRQQRHSFSEIENDKENAARQNHGANLWSERIREASNALPSVSAIRQPPHSHNVEQPPYASAQNRHRLYNPITHQEKLIPAQRNSIPWRY